MMSFSLLQLRCFLFIWSFNTCVFQSQAFLHFTTAPIKISSPTANSQLNKNYKYSNSFLRNRRQSQESGNNFVQDGDLKEKDEIYNQYYHLTKSLLEKISAAGTDGTKIPQDDRELILEIVQQLENLDKNNEVNLLNSNENVEDEKMNCLLSFSSIMTAISLVGEHKLLYTDTPNTPQYIGPFKGRTTQKFIDATKFQNILQLGSFLKIVLTADREIMDGKRIKLFFRHFAISLFGMKLVEKELDAKGVWKMVFVGELEMENCHSSIQSRKFLLRVMRTPKIYILAKEL